MAKKRRAGQSLASLVRQQTAVFGLWHQPHQPPHLPLPVPAIAPTSPSSQRAAVQHTMAQAISELQRRYPSGPRSELREKVRNYLAIRGTTPPTAYAAWRAWCSGLPHNRNGAIAWYRAIVWAASVVRPPRFPPP